MNWQITFEKFNEYYRGQTIFVITVILLIILFSPVILDLKPDLKIPVQCIAKRTVTSLIILHGIFTIIYFLNPVR